MRKPKRKVPQQPLPIPEGLKTCQACKGLGYLFGIAGMFHCRVCQGYGFLPVALAKRQEQRYA